ncbi:DNA-3-methyladenine glycosylase I [Nocardioides sp. zg-536]|uniref:DNA-3-methyladenine glycosylase I n=1 Tax=Nocardioides faecalis TaxID=2803858 RepID=A0A939BXK6_9ACTN|nr:DNA-3-methyladenine glycosylase I [Nocardioides faecalis]MBM9458935.1 DNA-3-methyladenine glycosylase I [Nocardioides faecalis]QVI60335.1 DNA-3-methyladenine glycosylase I [Nocardioides faecalis]
MTTAVPGPDGLPRCAWALGSEEMLAYHDDEWGFPVHDDRRLFEKVCLEGFQSGLSWLTILRKRPAFREAFADFDMEVVARFDASDVDRLLADTRIIRHRGKIEAAINNAGRALELVAEQGSLASYLWGFEPSAAELGEPQSLTTSPASVALSKDLKRRGWKFVGPTTMFALMQAMGLVNDHALGCVTREQVAQARARLPRPA